MTRPRMPSGMTCCRSTAVTAMNIACETPMRVALKAATATCRLAAMSIGETPLAMAVARSRRPRWPPGYTARREVPTSAPMPTPIVMIVKPVEAWCSSWRAKPGSIASKDIVSAQWATTSTKTEATGPLCRT